MKEGWICPKCGKVLAPWIPECDCYKRHPLDSNPVYPNNKGYPIYEPAPYWTNPEWKPPVPMCTASDVHGFTDEEMDLYWKTIQKKSVATGVNINELFKVDDKNEDE